MQAKASVFEGSGLAVSIAIVMLPIVLIPVAHISTAYDRALTLFAEIALEGATDAERTVTLSEIEVACAYIILASTPVATICSVATVLPCSADAPSTFYSTLKELFNAFLWIRVVATVWTKADVVACVISALETGESTNGCVDRDCRLVGNARHQRR
ncbi:hypothetical protein Aperf_G00000118945 [Anoplocephala perfoliata]